MAIVPENTSCHRKNGAMPKIARSVREAITMCEQRPEYVDVREKLKETLDLVNKIEPYMVAKSTPISNFVQKLFEKIQAMDFDNLYKMGKVRHNYSKDSKFLDMVTPPGQVQLLQFLIRKMKARKVLEVGSYMGFATFGMAEAMEPEGTVTGIDIEPLFCDFVNELAQERDIGVEVLYGDALAILRAMTKEDTKFDLIYIDCVKDEYHEYFKIIIDGGLLSPGGLIVCDSLLLSGETIYRSTDEGKVVDDFSTMVMEDERVTSVPPQLTNLINTIRMQSDTSYECAHAYQAYREPKWDVSYQDD